MWLTAYKQKLYIFVTSQVTRLNISSSCYHNRLSLFVQLSERDARCTRSADRDVTGQRPRSDCITFRDVTAGLVRNSGGAYGRFLLECKCYRL